ncbi:unnamed protein product, partial [Closterium sp. NIES-53]
MASPIVLTFDAEGRAVHFDVWVDDLQLFLQCDSRDGESLFDHTSGVSTAPAAIADSTVRLQWTTRDAVARRAVCIHLPSAERVHFGQYKTAHESAAPGAGESALSSTAPTEALHTFTLDSGASRSFFRDSTTLTPLSRPVAVSLADPSGGPVLAHSSTVLPCRACCRDSTSPRSPRTWFFLPRPGLVLRRPPARVVLCHTRLSFGTTALVTPPCLVFEGHERYFLLVVDDYSRYTTVFPLRSNGETKV